MKDFSGSWNSSKKPKKQRKFRYEAPLHIRNRFLGTHLSKELRQKYGKRSVTVRKGDKVKVMRGQFRGQTGKVERVDLKNSEVFVSKIEVIKKDGTKTLFPFQPSNLLITELLTEDKRRLPSKKNEKKKEEGKE